MGPNHFRHLFSKPRFWAHVGLPFASILAPFGTLGSPKVRFFACRGALARTFAHTARASAILSEFGCPKGVPEVSRRLRRGTLWGNGKTALGTSGR